MARVENAQGLRYWSSYISIAIVGILLVVKLYAWLVTDSVSLLTSVVDAFVDGVAAFVTLLGVRIADRPPDQSHRYGHDKGEAIAALVQGLLLAGAAVAVFLEAISRLLTPHPLEGLELGAAIIGISVGLTAALWFFQGYVVALTGSQAVSADRTHRQSDLLLNLAILVALGVTRLTGWQRVDPLFAIGITGFMMWSASRIAREAIDTLLDHELPVAYRQRIKEIVGQYKEARGIHDLRTRSSGRRAFVEFHLEFEPRLSVEAAHGVADEIERAIKAAIPHSEILIHQEPAGIEDERLDSVLIRSRGFETGRSSGGA